MDSPLGNLRDLFINEIKLVPSWINPGTLPLLSRLVIVWVSQVRWQDIQVLGMLQALTSLEIRVPGWSRVRRDRFLIGADAFPCLVVCELVRFPVVPSMFAPGAMPRLKRFMFSIDLTAFTAGARGGDLASVDEDLALGHLPSL